jgi:oxygen-independent coproporphyrinogen-3 oxidase
MLARNIATGRIAEPDPDEAADRYEQALDLLGAAGYEQYEICNWALPGRQCRHNLVYWRNEAWLGLGPGAHSFLSPYRFADIKAPDEYIQRLSGQPSPLMGDGKGEGESAFILDEAAIRSMPATDFVECLSPALERAETAILGLRLNEGLSRERFRGRFGIDPALLYAQQLAELQEWGLVEVTPTDIRLTPRGRLLGNEVFARLLPDEEPASVECTPTVVGAALQGGDAIDVFSVGSAT